VWRVTITFLVFSGALPVVAAVHLNELMTLPVVYDFPACNSTAYTSLLACPRAPLPCGEDTPARGGAGGNLGTLTDHGRIGRRALAGVVGVSCQGNLYSIAYTTAPY
jgi:hypothetical protein